MAEPSDSSAREARLGVLAVVAACVIWGLSPLYYRLLAHVPPPEILAHRTLWSLAAFGALLAWQGRLRAVPALLGARRRLGAVALAGLMISVNWLLFILATQIDRVTETSLGYYIFPLVAVLFGVTLFGERLSPAKGLAVALAAAAVLVLTVGLGAAPWISLALAVTFGLYGVLKKRMEAGPVVSVTAEVLLLAPVALIWLAGVHGAGWVGIGEGAPGVFGADLRASLLLVVSGPLTAGPLILFSYATRRIALATAGLVQYLNPTLQFGCALLVFGEAMTLWHAIAFPLIWTALAIYSLESLRQDRAARSRSIRRATELSADR